MQGQTPLIPTWTSYWDENESIFIPDRGYFNYYASGKEGDPVVLFVHGGGYTGLTWSLVAKKLKGKGLRLLAPDLRGHGLTRSDEEEDFSKETLSQDVAALWEHLVVQPHNRRITGSSSESSVSSEEFCGILVGHSMGAALSVWAALGPLQPDPNLSQVEGEKGEGQPSVPQNDASTSSSSTTLSNSSSAWATPAPASYPGRIASGAATEPGVKAVRLKGLGGLIMIDVVEGTAIGEG